MQISVVILFVIGLNVCESMFGWWFRNKNNEMINTIDIVYHSPVIKEDISIQNMSNSFPTFDPRLPFKLLIHGWRGSANGGALEVIKTAYLDKGGVNLFSADWSMGAMQKYHLSRSFVSVAGKQIGQRLDYFFVRMNISLDQVHILGFSLGAHVAGNVGKYFKRRINRITGLDPAGPLFKRTSRDAISRDARFVDSIHTDVGILGEMSPRAHIDFYPNRGCPPQPGCLLSDAIKVSTCSHIRAPIYYAETIMLPNNFLAVKCDRHSLSMSIQKCRLQNNLNRPTRTLYMGENCPNNARGIYYLETNSYPPYGQGYI